MGCFGSALVGLALTVVLHQAGALVATVLGRIAVLWLPVAVGFAVLPWALKGPLPKTKE